MLFLEFSAIAGWGILQAEIKITPQQIDCEGDWTIVATADMTLKLAQIELPQSKSINLSGKNIANLDSAGALVLCELISTLAEHDCHAKLIDFPQSRMNLIQLVQKKYPDLVAAPKQKKKEPFLYRVGEETINKLKQCDGYIILIGDLSVKIIQAFGNWKRFQLPSVASNIDFAGLRALPIVGLLSFLIGVVLTYQMGLQLQTYGANIFIAYLSGMAIFREFAPLITAVIVAGRTSSSFTAQLGSMKVNEEIDALKTMGLSTTELLVLPKVLGLLLIFPILIFWSDVFSIMGSMLISKTMLDVSYLDFLNRLKSSVGIRHFWVGLSKAPVFAILISLVGCFQGFRVGFSADSIGKQTTKSVVQAIFLIIVADAAFSIIYSWMDI
jgi:phospholipid/cholesterol/gamma-HCH transport system permease protein